MTPKTQDQEGKPQPGALLLVRTQKGEDAPIYTDAEMTILQTAPLVADDKGVFSPIFLKEGYYSLAVLGPDGTLIWSIDEFCVQAGGPKQ